MNLYLRLLWVLLAARFKPALRINQSTSLHLRVLPNDLDLNRHMNNGRFMSILDLAIVDILVRTRFMRVVRSLQAHIIEGGALITFRQQLTPFARYRLKLRYLGCNAHWHVFSFVFLNRHGAVAARGLVKGGAVRKRGGLVPAERIWSQYAALYGEVVTPPDLPAYARDWLDLETTVSHMPYGDEVDHDTAEEIDAGFTTRPARLDELPPKPALPGAAVRPARAGRTLR